VSQSTLTSDPNSGSRQRHFLLVHLSQFPSSTTYPVSIHHPTEPKKKKRGPGHFHTTATCGFMPAISGMVQVGSH
jgi:hypothetical protein